MTTKTKNIVLTCVMALFLFGVSVFCWVKPPNEYSDSERRKLAQMPSFPKLSADAFDSFSQFKNALLQFGDGLGKFTADFEDYTLDQFPMRDNFRTIKSFSSFYVFHQLDNNDIYIKDGYAAKLEYPLNESSIDRAADRFRYLYDHYMAGKDMNVYFSIVPDKGYFLAEQNGYLSLDYEKFISLMREKTDFMQYIDITGELSLEDYYKTDTHWRQEKLLGAAAKLADSMGITLSQTYTEKTLADPFYGVYYGQSALPLPAETIHYLTNDMLDGCTVINHETGKKISVYDMEKAGGKDPYEMFLSGPLSLITIENPNATTDKELIVFRDSFGSSIVPLLVEGYAKITLVDIRYIMPEILHGLIRFENQDVLFLYSTLVLNNSVTLK